MKQGTSVRALKRGRLIWIFMLEATAGYMNVATLLRFARPVSHHTGNVSQLALALHDGDLGLFLGLSGLIVSFFIGSMIAGMLLESQRLNARANYARLLVFSGLVLFISTLFWPESYLVLGLAALCAGIQNALFLVHRGTIVRTTHLTGYLTDAAFEIGSWLLGQPNKLRRAGFYLANLLVFLLGGLVAALLVERWGASLLSFGALAYIALGLISRAMRLRAAALARERPS